VLFKIDPVPYEIAVSNSVANVNSLREQLKSSQAGDVITTTKLALARKRQDQFTELAAPARATSLIRKRRKPTC